MDLDDKPADGGETPRASHNPPLLEHLITAIKWFRLVITDGVNEVCVCGGGGVAGGSHLQHIL